MPIHYEEKRVHIKAHRQVPIIALLVFILCIAGFSGYRVFHILGGYNESRQIYAGIREEHVSYDRGNRSAVSGSELNAADLAKLAVPRESCPISVDFNELRSNLNPEIIGWIWCQDTVIDYPVVQHADNEYYLNFNVSGEQNASGAIFLETSNFSDFRDVNSILHGHHMGDGTMFASLSAWQAKDYLDRHPVMYLSTPGRNYHVDLFAGFTTPANSIAYQYEFSSASDIQNWIDWVQTQSVIHSDLTLSPNDHFLTLSTCAYSYEDARTVLIGRLTEIA